MRSDWDSLFHEGVTDLASNAAKEQFEKFLCEADELGRRMSEFVSESSSDDNICTASVNANGSLCSVTFAPSFRDLEPEELARHVIQANERARDLVFSELASRLEPLKRASEAFQANGFRE